MSQAFWVMTALSGLFLSSLCQRVPKRREDNSQNSYILAVGKLSIGLKAAVAKGSTLPMTDLDCFTTFSTKWAGSHRFIDYYIGKATRYML